MKPYLLYENRDFDLDHNLPWNEQFLMQDLELGSLFEAMASGDQFLYDVVHKIVISATANSLEDIHYRQDILLDCMKNPTIVRDMYNITVEAIERERKIQRGIFSGYPQAILNRSIKVLHIFIETLKTLKALSDTYAKQFESQGFTTLFAMLLKELSNEYFEKLEDHMDILKFKHGVVISAALGKGNKGINYILRKPENSRRNWISQIFDKPSLDYSYTIADQDDVGLGALSDLRNSGINLAANALGHSCDQILNFIKMLRIELAFYIGSLNLQEQLDQYEEPICFPVPLEAAKRQHTALGIYDICLALTIKEKVVSNEMNFSDKHLIVVTGANQGGKSTFLRSIGLTQLMMQAGMYVPAESFKANICDNLFTHYRREEDTMMNCGKLEEELERMNDIINHITPNSLLLLNESFAATNEREGSEIAMHITSAFLESQHKVFFVTHLYHFAHTLYEKKLQDVTFLRAVREESGERSYKLLEGEPLQTSFGKDLYYRIIDKEQAKNDTETHNRGESF